VRITRDKDGLITQVVDACGTVTDNYVPSTSLRTGLDTFGRYVSGSGSTVNPYRYGGAWGYITDPSAALRAGPCGMPQS